MKIEEKFTELKNKKQKAFMAHVYYKDPDKDFSEELIKTMIDSGIDILELGIPHSDPTSDGPTFIKACERSLRAGTTPKQVISSIKKIRKYSDIPVIVTTYFNIAYRYGIYKFIKDIKHAGADGLIIPEAVVEESDELLKTGKKYGIDIIFIIGPYSSGIRIKKITDNASGFLYVVSRTGVTGVKKDLGIETSATIIKIKKYTDLPLLVGFGISQPEQVKKIIQAGADGVIIGSAIAKIYENYIENRKIINKEECLDEIRKFVKKIREDIKNIFYQKK
ncbi:tryptophan synthase subunit alpha [Candidatus Woesearchaeota archaeon]|nr:tryptophan synthase subunit alpha [Candidatus Woesearchaeota archaeon]